MDKPISELTYKVVAHSVVPDLSSDEFIDWAYEMLLLGHDTPCLLMLASISKPVSREDVLPYFLDALKELGITERNQDEAILFYAAHLLRQIAKNENVHRNLEKLYSLSIVNSNPHVIQDFYLLSCAWESLDCDGRQWYWEGATNDNIEHLVVEKAKEWLHRFVNQPLDL
jgi:hypothetical protein